MRISDWSSDVCSSDLVNDSPLKVTPCQQPLQCCTPRELTTDRRSCLAPYQLGRVDDLQFALPRQLVERIAQASCLDAVALWRIAALSSEERRVGYECVCTCRFRVVPSILTIITKY